MDLDDNAQAQGTSIKRLPREVLSTVLQYAPWSAIYLYLCGDKQLNYLLETGAVEIVDLEGFKTVYLPRWPRICERFSKLCSFSIKHFGSHLQAHTIREGLLNLPVEHLHTLSISCVAAATAFFDEREVYQSLSPQTHSPSPSVQTDSYSSVLPSQATSPLSSRLWDMNRFSSLRSLTIVSTLPVLPDVSFTAIWWEERYLASLPRTLEVLVLDVWPDRFCFNDLSLLPRSLLSVRLGPHTCLSQSAVSTLPPSLTLIDKCMDIIESQSLIYDHGALEHLVALHFRSSPKLFRVDDLDPTMLRSPPPRPLVASLGFHGSVYWRPAPVSMPLLNSWLPLLQHLDLDFLPSILGPEITVLRSLSYLRASSVDWNKVSASDWPPLLSTLRLYDDLYALPKEFHRLPRTLTYLSVATKRKLILLDGVKSPLEDELLKLGKKALKQDVILRSSHIMAPTYEQETRGFEQLRMTLGAKHYKALLTGRLMGLPIGLTELDYNSYPSFENHSVITAPPFVKRIRMARFLVEKQFEFFFQTLPVTATDVSIGDEGRDWHGIGWVKAELQQAPIFSPTTIMTTLLLDELPLGPFCFSLLPRTLTSLIISRFAPTVLLPRMSGAEVMSLPPLLKELRLPFLSPHEHAWTSFLPRRLLTADLLNTQCEGAELEFLPPRLTTLIMSSVSANLDQLRHLPRTLRHLVLQARPGDEDISDCSDDTILPPYLSAGSTLGSYCSILFKIRENVLQQRLGATVAH